MTSMVEHPVWLPYLRLAWEAVFWQTQQLEAKVNRGSVISRQQATHRAQRYYFSHTGSNEALTSWINSMCRVSAVFNSYPNQIFLLWNVLKRDLRPIKGLPGHWTDKQFRSCYATCVFGYIVGYELFNSLQILPEKCLEYILYIPMTSHWPSTHSDLRPWTEMPRNVFDPSYLGRKCSSGWWCCCGVYCWNLPWREKTCSR